jgi:hypothetical protein
MRLGIAIAGHSMFLPNAEALKLLECVLLSPTAFWLRF